MITPISINPNTSGSTANFTYTLDNPIESTYDYTVTSTIQTNVEFTVSIPMFTIQQHFKSMIEKI